jgi:hypothetical protein
MIVVPIVLTAHNYPYNSYYKIDINDNSIYENEVTNVVLDNRTPFVDQVTQPNTRYIIRDNFDLGGAGENGVDPVKLPENIVLHFDGGSIDNGTIIFNNTEIIGTRGFGNKLSFLGDVLNSIVDLNIFKDNTEPLYNINKLLGDYDIYSKVGVSYNCGKTFLVPKGNYTVTKGLALHGVSDITVDFCGSTITDVISTVELKEFVTTPLIWIVDASAINIINLNYKYSNRKKLKTFNSGIICMGARNTVTNNFKTYNISICNIKGDSYGFIPSVDDNYGLTAIGALGEVQNIFIKGCKWCGPITAFANFEWAAKGTQIDNYYGLRPYNISIDNIILEDVAYQGRCKGIRLSSSYNIDICNIYAHNCDNSISFFNGDYGIARVNQTAKFENVVHKNDKIDSYSRAFYFMTLYKEIQDSYSNVVNYHPTISLNNCVFDNLSSGVVLNNIEGNFTVQNCIFKNNTIGISGYVLYNEGVFLVDNCLYRTCKHSIIVDNKSFHIRNSIFVKSVEASNDIRPKITHKERYGTDKPFIIDNCQFKTIGERKSVDIKPIVDTNSFTYSLIVKNNSFENTSAQYPAVSCNQYLYTFFDSNQGAFLTSGIAVVDKDDEKKGLVATTNYNSENAYASLDKWNKVRGNILDARFTIKYIHDEGNCLVAGVSQEGFINSIQIVKTSSRDLTIVHNAHNIGSNLPIYISGYSNNDINVPLVIKDSCIIELYLPYKSAKYLLAVIKKRV